MDDQLKTLAYADDYSAIASWESRANWNLANVHDPTVEKCGEYFYMYGTDAFYGNVHAGRGHFPYRRSKDLVNWEFCGMAMRETPAWVGETLNAMRKQEGLEPIENPVFGHWAPVVRKAGGKYRMYYSIVVDNYIATGKPHTPANFDGSWTERAFIGLMETDDLESNAWEDRGMVVHSFSDRGRDWHRRNPDDWNGYFKWNAIDPSYIVTPEGEHWLVYGSWHSGIVAVQLDPSTGKPDRLESPQDFGVRIARREKNDRNRWQGLEAPEIIYNEATGYYYLFLAYDELSVAYNTRVARSRKITGPYVGMDGDISAGGECRPLLTHPYRFAGHSGWVGIAHGCVFRDADSGTWFFASQARLPAGTEGNAHSNAIMMGHVRQMRWTDDGWPVVMPQRYAAVPDHEITASDLAGEWEHITLDYRYRVQQASQKLVLAADHSASGALSGRWAYDPQKRQLVIGDATLLLARELDWEASPRRPTIVYAGFTDSGRSLWGKQVRQADRQKRTPESPGYTIPPRRP